MPQKVNQTDKDLEENFGLSSDLSIIKCNIVDQSDTIIFPSDSI